MTKMNRREWLGMGLGAGAVAASGWRPLWAQGPAADSLHMAVIPSTGERVPAVGLGTVSYQGAPGSEDEARLRETLQVFHDGGGALLDTSPNYGDSEEVLGRLLADLGIRGQAFMATKVDRTSPDEGEARMEGSFRRLGGSIELMQVHNLVGGDAMLPVLEDWKARGRFRYIGVTTHRQSQHDGIERCMRETALDFVQINYSLADRAADDRLLPLAQDHGIAVLVNRPFGKGELFRRVRGLPLPDWASDIDAESWGQVFLKYIIAHPAATIPIPGTSKPHHAADNLGALRGRLPDAALRAEMERYLDRLEKEG